MNLTLKDVYDLRSGIIDFANKLFSNGDNLVPTVNRSKIGDLISSVRIKPSDGLKRKKDESKEDYNKRLRKAERENDKAIKDCSKELTGVVSSGIKEFAKHSIALDVYSLLVEKHQQLLEANKGKENDPVIVEFGKNIDIFKSQMLKNGVYNMEIIAKEKKDRNLDARIRHAITKNITEEYPDLFNKYGLTINLKDGNKFMEDLKSFFDMENLEKFDAKEINETNQPFYGMLKNSGFDFSRSFNADYYNMPEKIEKCPSGYKFNEAGEMVEKESKGFFSSIGNFFGRLFNKGKVATYNNNLRQSKAAANNENIMKDVENMKKLESEKELVDLGKEFENASEIAKDYQKELAVELKMMKEQEKQQPEEAIGSGLDQIDL